MKWFGQWAYNRRQVDQDMRNGDLSRAWKQRATYELFMEVIIFIWSMYISLLQPNLNNWTLSTKIKKNRL